MSVEVLVGLSSDVSDALFERYCGMAARLGSSRVLALVDGTASREWQRRLRAAGEPRAEDKVLSPGSWVRRELDVWWPLVEAGLASDGLELPPGVPSEPLFVQADLAQELMAAGIEPYCRASGAFATSRTPQAMRHVHLLDTLQKAVEQDLDLDDACGRLVAGAAAPDAAAHRQHVLPCLTAYRDLALRHRVLDGGLAWWVFGRYLLSRAEFLAYLRRGVAGLVVGAFEEAGPLLRRAVRAAAAGAGEVAGDVAIGWRADGGVRGTACRDVELVLAEWHGAVRVDVPGPPAGSGPTPLAEWGWRLAGGVRDASGLEAASLAPGAPLALVQSGTFPEMLDRVVAETAAEREAGRSVAVILPRVTQLQLWWLRRALGERGLPTVVAAGTNRLVDFRPVRVALALASVAFPRGDRFALDRDQWTDILEEVTGEDAYVVAGLADELAGDHGPLLAGGDGPLAFLGAWLRDVREAPGSLGGLFRSAFAQVLAPRDGDLEGPGSDAAWERADQLNQLVETAERFEAVDLRLGGRWGERPGDPGLAGRVGRFCEFLLAGSFAERPMGIRPQPAGAIVLATASRFAQDGEPVDVQLWLDCSSPAWLKGDDRELANARALVAEREPGPYGLAESQADSADKLARTVLACAARARWNIRCHASLLDSECREQPGGLADVIGELVPAEAGGA